MNDLAKYWSSRLDDARHIKVFRKATLALLAVYLLYLLPAYAQLLGSQHILFPREEAQGIFTWLQHKMGTPWPWVALSVLLLIIAFRLLGHAKKLADFFIFFITAQLFNALYLVHNGGHRLLLIMLFLLIFMDEDVVDEDTSNYAAISRSVTHTSWWLLKLQVCLVYAVAGVTKLMGVHWLSGDALWYIVQIDEFTTPALKKLVAYPNLLQVLTWATIAYQILFPILVWIRSVKAPFLLIGVTMHLAIAHGMGLVDFGWIMLLAYIPFVDWFNK